MTPPVKPVPRIALTMGDPAGIGPEVLLKALLDPDIRRLADFTVFGDSRLWPRCCPDIAGADLPAGIQVIEFPEFDFRELPPPEPTTLGGKSSIAFVASAVEAVKQGQTDAIVTGPIHKQAIKMAGYPWPGHTELLAEKFGASHVAMMFAGGPFRVVLATIHIPLADVPRSLTTEGVVETICLADDALRKWFGIGKPTIGVLGLNPHASDGGRFGHEEEQIIEPAIREAARRGIAAVGPVVPDVAFRQATEGRFDCLVAMYHDQALIPVKTVAFDKAVNITLGIDCIRTSVDHGTAYDIAGRGVADPSSMKAAIRMAAAMASTAAP